MVKYCVAFGCRESFLKGKGIQFHKFPLSRPKLLKSWENAVRRKNWKATKASVLCSLHFTEDSYKKRPGALVKHLKDDAVPSIFSFDSVITNNRVSKQLSYDNCEMIKAEEEEDDDDDILKPKETNVLFIKEEKISDDEDEMDNEGNLSGNESKHDTTDNNMIEDVCDSLQHKEIEYIKCEVDVWCDKDETQDELDPLFIPNDQLNIHNSCGNNKASALVDNCSTLPSPTSEQVDCNNTSSNLNSKEEDTGCPASRRMKIQMNNCLNNNCGLLECTECGFSTTNKLIFSGHVKIHNLYKCPSSTMQEESNAIHNSVFKEELLKCTYCEYSTYSKYKFKIHLRTHIGKRHHLCTVCGKSFVKASGLRTHMKIHTGEKPFKCTLCDYSSVQSHHVTSHMRTVHTKEKPFKCTECEFTTAHQNSLTSHMRLHTGECPFICPQCDFSAARKSTLIKHLRTHIFKKINT